MSPVVHASQPIVAPTFYFGDPDGHVYTLRDTLGDEWSAVQAYWATRSGPDFTYTLSNLHPENTGSDYFSRNGVWYRYWYDLTSCYHASCSTHANYSWIESYVACPQNFGAFEHADTPSSHTVYCQNSNPDAQSSPKCDSCFGNPIYASSGQKVQVEKDYAGLPGLTFDRTYRSSNGFFASTTTSLFIDYSPATGGNTTGCFSSYYNKPGLPPGGGLKPYCFPYMTVAQQKYQLATTDGRYLQFSGPNTSITQYADINERVTRVINASGAVEWHVSREDDSTEIYNATGALTQIIQRNGQVTSYTYSDASTPASIAPRPGLLLSKTDAFGHTLTWQYNTAGRMAQMQDPGGGIYQYSYDSMGNLSSVVYPDGSTKGYSYNESAYTGGSNLPQALTGITDENGIRFATFKYDSYMRGSVLSMQGASRNTP